MGLLRYSGKETLTFETPLDLPMGLLMHVPDRDGIVRLLGKVNLRGELKKTGYGTLLIEAPFHAYEGWFDDFWNRPNRWNGKRSLILQLDGGTLGIAPDSLKDKQFGFYVSDDSELFALNGNINISWDLFIDPDAHLDVIGDPNDLTPLSITFSGDKYDHGTINQRSYGDLIFEGTDHFKGTINTYGTDKDGKKYGRLVLNGDTGANIEMNGGEIAGRGRTRGKLIARDGAIISPGDNDGAGTLIFGNVDFDSSTILNFKLGLPNVVGNSQNDLIQVNGSLTLAGTVNIQAQPKFGPGVYRLFDYDGQLTYKGLTLGTFPGGIDYNFQFQTSIDHQINLIVGSNRTGGPVFWNGRTTPNGQINGGSGIWDNTKPNFTDSSGNAYNQLWNGDVAIFGGSSGAVSVTVPINFNGIQFTTSDYIITASSSGSLNTTSDAFVRVPANATATIAAPITGSIRIKQGRGRNTIPDRKRHIYRSNDRLQRHLISWGNSYKEQCCCQRQWRPWR